MRPGAINKTSQAEVTARLHETPNGRTMMISHDDNNDDDSRKSAHLVPCVHFCSNAPQSFSNEFNKTHNLSLFQVEMHFFGDGDAFTQFLVSDPDFLSISSNGFLGFPLQMIYFLLSLLLYFIFFQVLSFHGLFHSGRMIIDKTQIFNKLRF